MNIKEQNTIIQRLLAADVPQSEYDDFKHCIKQGFYLTQNLRGELHINWDHPCPVDTPKRLKAIEAGMELVNKALGVDTDKEINPEALPDLLSALKGIIAESKYYEAYDGEAIILRGNHDVVMKAIAAIEKAEN